MYIIVVRKFPMLLALIFHLQLFHFVGCQKLIHFVSCVIIMIC